MGVRVTLTAAGPTEPAIPQGGQRVDPGNAEQARAWDGAEGAYWARNADRYDESVRAYHQDFLAAAGIGAADRVLDIGCGTGQTTRDAALLAVSGSALGVDLSAAMLAVARQRAERAGLRNVTFEQGDAQVHPFAPAAYDVAISRTGAMFFADRAAAFAAIAAALRPGGRLVLLTWQGPERNEWFRAFRLALAAGRELPAPPPDGPGPFALSDPAAVDALLRGAGFRDVRCTGLERPMVFGPDAAQAREFLLGQFGWLLAGLDAAARERAVAALGEDLAAHQTPDGVAYRSATWLVTARRAS